jgi:hypothetical protein
MGDLRKPLFRKADARPREGRCAIRLSRCKSFPHRPAAGSPDLV